MNNIEKQIIDSDYARKEMIVDTNDCAYTRWQNKVVHKEKLIFEVKENTHKELGKIPYGKLSIHNKHVMDGKYTLCLSASNDVENLSVRPTTQIKIDLNGIDIHEYNRVKFYVYLDAKGFQNMYFHFNMVTESNFETHTASVYANQMNLIIWELDEETISSPAKYFSIQPFFFGTPPEADPNIKIYINNIYLQNVDKEYELGWELQDRIAYSHVGYFTDYKKTALVSKLNNLEFKVVNENNNKVYKFNASKIENDKNINYLLDFTTINKEGTYHIEYDDKKTPNFEISKNPYELSIYKSMNFLKSLRCGEEVVGVHSACHLNCRCVEEDLSGKTKSVPVFGGWHDAGDLSQFEIPTSEMTHAIADLALSTKDKELKKRLIEEVKVGANWLLRTTFHDGARALAVSYKLWRDNLVNDDNEQVRINRAEQGAFENFLSAAALAKCAYLFKKDKENGDKIFSDWCLRIAKEDFKYAKKQYEEGIYSKRWGITIDSQTCGHGCLAACELYKITNDENYINVAATYANIVMKCQQLEYTDWEKPLRGFFYEDKEHKYILAYEHRGHEQSPIQGICALADILEHGNYLNDNNYLEILSNLKKSIDAYCDYVKDTLKYTSPYGLIPGHVYDINKINPEHFTFNHNELDKNMNDMKDQIKGGIRLDNDVYLRVFPVAVQRRGYHATLLSKTKGLSACARLYNNQELMQIVVNQLEWVLGYNPFASSTMYGEGHNYHPLYVAYSRQMVGALPVGIKTKGNLDLPYWPTRNNAVYKEIWGHTTGKYLWILADIMDYNKNNF